MEDVTANHAGFRATAKVPVLYRPHSPERVKPVDSFHMRKGADEPTKFGYYVLAKMAEHEPPLSQADLARLAGVGQATISRWILSPGRPNSEKLRLLAEALDVDYEVLMTIAGYGKPSGEVTTALEGLRPDVHPLAAEFSSMLDQGSPLPAADRDFLQHTIDRLIDPYRRQMRRRRSA
jgi:transcriptional regulator with XRE-family HTH domain